MTPRSEPRYDPGGLAGTEWWLESLHGRDLFEDTSITLDFDEDALRGNSGCNQYGTHDIRLEEKPVPELGPREVPVEIKAVGVCGSDVHYYGEGRIGSFVVEEPLILGHESMGTVVALGEEASKHEVGERVTLEPGVPDMTCRECRAGRYNLCPNVRFFATPTIDGAFANYVAIHEDFASRCLTTSRTTPERSWSHSRWASGRAARRGSRPATTCSSRGRVRSGS